MKRDLDLIRKLLLFLDEHDGQAIKLPLIDGYDDKFVIQYHLNLLFDAGYIWGEPTYSTTSNRLITVVPFDVTWAGHEFLDRIRNPHIWDEVRAEIKMHGFVSASVQFVMKLADRQIRKRLELDKASN